MQQRRVRLGDVLDDYCPRERRVTNHVVVAMIEDAVKQTRCSTCDADHEYKAAKVPSQRRRKVEGALAAEGESEGRPELVAVEAAEAEDDLSDSQESPDPVKTPAIAEAAAAAVATASEAEAEEVPEAAGAEDVWVHRPLIRAVLPRREGDVPERKEPEFTMRSAGRFDGANRNGQRPNRGFRPQREAQGQFGNPRPRHGAGGGGGGQGPQGERNGNRAPQPGQRSGGGRPGGGQGRGPKRGGR
jgi:hypothetical protein